VNSRGGRLGRHLHWLPDIPKAQVGCTSRTLHEYYGVCNYIQLTPGPIVTCKVAWTSSHSHGEASDCALRRLCSCEPANSGVVVSIRYARKSQKFRLEGLCPAPPNTRTAGDPPSRWRACSSKEPGRHASGEPARPGRRGQPAAGALPELWIASWLRECQLDEQPKGRAARQY
jgi:hypothetical protein